ncbi:flagellin [Phenylobacterium aquaticum]|uniref:flagellin n=1 Tax=Phenylobacterium aquaticum TaxID=1763816 RepID=UPI001F5D7681|nr:flagellin [Phenylobacterium aquaticum]MCI3134922.1 flagellin [Phenylobacterium aquaticum]
MPNSINTNPGAMIALQNLNSTQADLMAVQNRVNTGRKVASAKDNGAIWAIAQNQRATSGALNAVKDSLNRNQSAIDVAIAGGENIEDLLIQMKEKALAASDTSLDATSRVALNEDFKGLRDQINRAIFSASFNGENALSLDPVSALADADGQTHLTVSGPIMVNGVAGGLAFTQTDSIGTQTLAQDMIAKVSDSLVFSSKVLAMLGTNSKALSTHLTFVTKLQDAIDAGVGNLVDADLAKDSAKLTSLQTRQQLGVQALSIANQTPQALMSLFR